MRVDHAMYGKPCVFTRDGFISCSLPEFRHYVRGGKPFVITPDRTDHTRMLIAFEDIFDGTIFVGLNLFVDPSDVDGPGAPAGMA